MIRQFPVLFTICLVWAAVVILPNLNELSKQQAKLDSLYDMWPALLSALQKWRRRWFVLRPSGQVPQQYVLEYYTDQSYRKLKGTIDLDQCDQVGFSS